MDYILNRFENIINLIVERATDASFYTQLGIIALVIAVAWIFSLLIRNRFPSLKKKPAAGGVFYNFRLTLHHAAELIFPLLITVLMGLATDIATQINGENEVVALAFSLSVVFLVYSIIHKFVKDDTVKSACIWVGIPLAVLYIFGWLDNVIHYLNDITLKLGNINFSLYDLFRTILFGAILFWFGRLSNNIGTQAIRQRQNLDVGTREVLAKLFEITIVIVFFILLLQIMGINLTALAVFGGALGVGLGFGLQQIAANFISGLIILLDRSIAIGDYIELEDGRAGMLRELNMRYAILETYDGKDIMVPNEQFITSSYINWTHKNKKQRYSLEFQVAYKTDLDLLFEVVREVVASHPKVISGPDIPIEERPDAEIMGFGDSGIDILVEFWMEGIDDGVNRVGADLLHMIWNKLREHDIEIPFPQREVRLLDQGSA